MSFCQKLALGTAQFGLHYGIGNRDGQIPIGEIETILNRAWQAGINSLDTAFEYGVAESQLGLAGISRWRTISKIPAIPARCPHISAWIDSKVDQSLDRLQINRLYGLLLHRSADLLGNQGDRIQHSLEKLKEGGRVEKIGVSIYDFSELEEITSRYVIDLVQVPFNCIDRRLIDSGCLTRLKQIGIEVHVRSVFLQGLLLMEPDSRPEYFKGWKTLFEIWDNWLLTERVDPIDACLGLPMSLPGIDRIVVGINHLGHLNQILERMTTKAPLLPDGINCSDLELIDPSRWKV